MSWAAGLLFWLALATTLCWRPERWLLTMVEAGLQAQAALWLLRAGSRATPVRSDIRLYLLAAAVAWMGILAATSSEYRFASYESLAYWAVLASIYLLGRQVFAEPTVRRRFLSAFLLFGVATATLALVQHPTSGGKFLWLFDSGYPDLVGPFPSRNQFAAFAELVVPVVFWRALRDPRHRTVWLFVTAGLWASVAAAASRAGTILVSAELVALLAIVWRQRLLPRRAVTTGATAVASLAAVSGLLFAWEPFWRRVSGEDLLGYRWDIYGSTLEMIASRPWTGFGPGTFETIYPAFARFDIGQIVSHAHNDWLEIASGGGIPLLLVLGAFAAWHLRPALRSIWGLGVIAVLLHAAVDYPLERLSVAGWLFAMLAAVGAAAAESEKLGNNRADPGDKEKRHHVRGDRHRALHHDPHRDSEPGLSQEADRREGSGRAPRRALVRVPAGARAEHQHPAPV